METEPRKKVPGRTFSPLEVFNGINDNLFKFNSHMATSVALECNTTLKLRIFLQFKLLLYD